MPADIRADAKYAFGSFVVDTANRRLMRDGAPMAITARVFDILVVLVRYHGRPVEKDTLIEQVWGDQAVEEGNLTRNVSTLRKVLGEAPDDHRFIVTLPGRGYQFVAAVRLLDDDEPEPVEAPAAPDAPPAVESSDVLPAAPVVDPPTLANCAWTCARRCAPVAALVLVVVVTLAAAHALTRAGGGATANANESDAPAMPWHTSAGAGRLSLVATHHRAFDPSLSPDGKLFVYATEDAGQRVDLFFGRTSGGGHVRLTNDSA
jgi:DNA-binding winged helix-turn-helix (wHTH) protein